MYYAEPSWGVTPKPALEPWRQLLLDAENVMQQRGLAKRTIEDAAGRVCLFGALYIADGGVVTDHTEPLHWDDRLRQALQAIAKVIGRRCTRSELMAWNDEPERTKEQVITVLRAARA